MYPMGFSNSVFDLMGLESGLGDGVGVAVVGDHDVLIAAAGTDREASGVVYVQLFDGLDSDVDFVGTGRRAGCLRQQREQQRRPGGRLGLGRPDALLRPQQVAFDGLIGVGVVFGNVGVGESGPCGVIAGLDG